ncbi:MAG: thiamine diphosphokinase [Cruoricaptor ignavus]|nr:thiamine diphosphokinase [Cruoricaptor ignavus]
MKKALLFINGEPPKTLPNYDEYDIIACTDGAFLYLEELGFPLKRLDFVSGDFDSHLDAFQNIDNEDFKVIHTPDQDKTDFDKALDILLEQGVSSVDVFGASGGEMDHFLGNLTAAFRMKNEMEICFYDEYSAYYFVPKKFHLSGVKGKMISLFPFPTVEKLFTKGLNWNLSGHTLSMQHRIGTRNFALEDDVFVDYKSGELLVFVGR